MDIPTVIRELVDEWDTPPHIINAGQCEDFAAALMDKLDAARLGIGLGETTTGEMMATPMEDWDVGLDGHFWVTGDGLHYDAECPEGVEDWRDLPFFLRLT